jgi:hypothetical protein
MQQLKKQFDSLDSNKKRCITLIFSSFISYFIFFPLNILVVYLIIQGYTKNKENILEGVIDEIKILWKMLMNVRKSQAKKYRKKAEEWLDEKETNDDFDVLDNTNIEKEIITNDKKEE